MNGGHKRPAVLRWIVLALFVLAVLDIRLFMLVDAAREETLERARDTLHVSVDVVA